MEKDKSNKIFTAKELERARPRVMKSLKHSPDYIIISVLVILVCFGMIMIYSSSYYSNEIKNTSSGKLFLKQLICAALGGFAIIGINLFDYHRFVDMKAWILWGSFLLMLAVFIPGLGSNVHGASRWINFFGISVQPTEIMKFALIVFISGSIGTHQKELRSLDIKKRSYVYYVILLGVICVPIYFMPNMSAIICIAALVFIMLFVGGADLRHMGVTLLLAVAALSVLIIAAPYRVGRLLAFIDPFNTTAEAAYQLRQSLFSIASGGLFGRGLGNSMQKLMYLPFSESDFIFSIVVEETGLVGASLLILLYGVLIYRGIKIAIAAPDITGCLLATGVVAIIGIQVVVNIAVCTGCAPPTGVVLPFISYGGSAVSVFMAMVGLLINVSRYTVKTVKVDVYE